MKGLSEAGDGGFTRHVPSAAAETRPPGFGARAWDITALGDSVGDLLTSPVRDAPPIARDASRPPPKPQSPRPGPAPGSRTSRARSIARPQPQRTTRAGYLAVHSVEKSFGSRKIVRGVSIYVRRGEAVGLLGPNGAGKTTVFYMITGLIKADAAPSNSTVTTSPGCRCISAPGSASAICRRKPRSFAG